MARLLWREVDLASAGGLALLEAMPAAARSLARCTSLLETAFTLRSELAPGCVLFGATAAGPAGFGQHERFSVGGMEREVAAALASCLGEAVERVSQLEQPGDVVGHASPSGVAGTELPGVRSVLAAVPRDRRTGGAGELAWVAAQRLLDGAPVLVPADWCLRRSRPDGYGLPGVALSVGCAAGESRDGAATRALLELIERDAADLWWSGGRRPAHPPAGVAQSAAAFLRILRGPTGRRETRLLDLTSDIGVPVAAALSHDADGRGLCVGLAARIDPLAACRAALLEMCQMEIGLELARRKLERNGEVSLAPSERHQLRLAQSIDARVALRETKKPVGPACDETTVSGAASGLETLTRRLAASGIEAALVELTRAAFGVSVIKAVAPILQQLPGDQISARLAAVQAACGGAPAWTRGVPLM